MNMQLNSAQICWKKTKPEKNYETFIVFQPYLDFEAANVEIWDYKEFDNDIVSGLS